MIRGQQGETSGGGEYSETKLKRFRLVFRFSFYFTTTLEPFPFRLATLVSQAAFLTTKVPRIPTKDYVNESRVF